MKKMQVRVSALKPGDFVVPAKAVVLALQFIGPLAIVDFTDNTSTAPIPHAAFVKIERPNALLAA